MSERPAKIMRRRQDKKAGGGKSALQPQVEAKMRSQLNSQAVWFTLFVACVQAVWIVVLFASRSTRTRWYNHNFVPIISQAASFAVRCLVLVVSWQITYRGRCLWVNQQVCHSVTVCLDGALVAMTNPEVQYYLHHRMPWLRTLGERPTCGHDGNGVSNTDGQCSMPVQMYQSIQILLIGSAFYAIFILRFRHAAWATSFAFVTFQVMRIIALGSTMELGADLMNLPGPVLLLLILLLAKRKIENVLQQLFLELLEKQREVVDEKVKRFQAEFQSESARAKHDAGSKTLTSLRGSDTASSGAAFHLEQRCEEEEDFFSMSKMQEMASWGRREHWLLDPLHLTLHPRSVLGSGSFGTVFSGCLAGCPVAVKLARMRGVVLQIQELANELRIIRHVRHPNIALFHGACFEPALGVFGLVLELVEGTCLDEYVRTVIRSHGQVASPTIWSILLDINRALYYLHTRDPAIVHGDIKPANIMLEQSRLNMRCKLLDFGISRILSPKAQRLGGTRTWMAPEVGAGCMPSTTADVYSYGLVAFFVVTGQNPRQLPLMWPNNGFSHCCRQLAECCLQQSPESRVGMEELHAKLLSWPGDLGWHRSLTRSFLGVPWAEALRQMRGSEEDSIVCQEQQTMTLRQQMRGWACQQDSDQPDLHSREHNSARCSKTLDDRDKGPELGTIGAAGHMMAL